MLALLPLGALAAKHTTRRRPHAQTRAEQQRDKNASDAVYPLPEQRHATKRQKHDKLSAKLDHNAVRALRRQNKLQASAQNATAVDGPPRRPVGGRADASGSRRRRRVNVTASPGKHDSNAPRRRRNTNLTAPRGRQVEAGRHRKRKSGRLLLRTSKATWASGWRHRIAWAGNISLSRPHVGWARGGWEHEMCAQGASKAGRGQSCTHKGLLERVSPLDLAAMPAFAIVAALAISAGIGGGGLFVPALTLGLQFSPQQSTGLSQSLIFGASLGAVIVNGFARHPVHPSRPLIDLPVAAFLAPAEMAGAQMGVLLNRMLPSPVILVAMTALLSVIAMRTLRKGLTQLRIERGRASQEEKSGLIAAPSSTAHANAAVHASGGFGAVMSGAAKMSPHGVFATLLTPPAAPHAADALPAKGGVSAAGAHSRSSQWDVMQLAALWAGLLLILLVRGGKGVRSLIGIRPCDVPYWTVTVAAVAGLLTFAIAAGRRVVGAASVSKPAAGDVCWTSESAAVALQRTIAAGIVAGLMGVGGGIVLGPLMIEMDMEPQVSSATTATMVLLTSSSAATVFIMSGISPVDYSIALGSVTFLGGLLGKAVVSSLVRRHRCTSFLVLLLGGMIAASVVCVGATGILDVSRRLEHGESVTRILALRGLCSS